MALLKRKFHGNGKKPAGPGQISSGAPGENPGGDGFGPSWGDFFSTAGFMGDQLSKTLMEPSDDINKMALRSVFAVTDLPDMREVIACYERYNRFGQKRDLENLKLLLASAPAIGGLARIEFMQGGSRILAESALQHSMDIRTGDIFRKNKNKNQNLPESKMHYPSNDGQETGQ